MELPDTMQPGASDAVLKALIETLGADSVLTENDISDKYLRDWSGETANHVLAVVRPRHTEDVARTLKICHAHRWPVVPQGGLTGLAGGAVPVNGAVIISMERMSGIESIDRTSATMTVWAGTPLQTLQEAAHNAGFFFALDLGARGSCQIGGNIATNAGGNRVIRYGMTRDLVLGLEVVLADGTILPMLNKMVKNNAGPDIKQAFIGSEGTLGVITRAVLRLHPQVTGANTALLAMADFDAATQLLRYAQQQLSGLVSAFEIMWADYYQSATTVGGIRAPLPPDYPLYILMDMQSANPEQNAPRFEQVLEHALETGWALDAAVAQSHADADAFWKLRDAIAELLKIYAPAVTFDLSFPVSRIGVCVARLKHIMQKQFPNLHVMFFGHVGDGNIHVVAGPLPNDGGQSERAIEAAFYALAQEESGSVSAEHGIGLHKKPWLPYSRTPEEIAMMRTMKRALDPHNILNPGKIFDL